MQQQMSKQSMSVPTPEPSKPAGKYHVVEEAGKQQWGVNLLPGMGKAEKLSSIKKSVGLGLAVLIPIALLVGWYFIIGLQQKILDEKIVIAEKQMSQLQAGLEAKRKLADKNAFLEKKMLAIKGLLDDHIYWSKFFDELEKYTLDKVYYTDFNADTGGELLLPAVAQGVTVAERYQTIAEQLTAFEQADDFVKTVTIENVALETTEGQGITGASFDIKLTLKDDVFTK